MNKKLTTLISVFFISTIAVTPVFGARTGGKTLLPEGYVLRGVEGKLIRQDSYNVWLFNFKSTMNDKKEVSDVNEALEVLSTSALEAAIADANLSAAGYRLWGRVTKYKGRNFIFPVDFLPVGKTEDPNSLTSQQSQEQTQPLQENITEPNDDLGIPKEVLEKLKTTSRATPIDRLIPPEVRRRQPERQMQPRQDSIMVNRTGFLEKCNDGSMMFNLDALGRSIQQTSIRLLPCEVLESAEQRQSVEPDPVRFDIAGIITEYKGCKYLLLQRATREYSYGNFGR